MADNLTPGLQSPINYSGEKPYYDNGEASAPVPQNAQPNYYPNQYNYPNNPTVNPGYSSSNINTYEQPYYVNNMNNMNTNVNNNNNLFPNVPELSKKLLCKQLSLGILLLIVAIIDIILQIVFKYPNPLAMGDDVAVLIIASVLLIFSYRKKIAKNCLFGFFTGFVWFVGFGCKGFAMQYIFANKKISGALVFIPIIYFFLIIPRTFGLFFSIPLVCEGQ